MGQSHVLCPLVGPGTESPGIYGTDLGFSAVDPDRPDRLALLFGDTWARPGRNCQYPVLYSDDLAASLPLRRPAVLAAGEPASQAQAACWSLKYPLRDSRDPTSWERIRLLEPRSDGELSVLTTDSLKTPIAAFSDGKRLFALYGRADVARCGRSSDCPAGMQCSADPEYRGRRMGVCGRRSSDNEAATPSFCRDVGDCRTGLSCNPADRGVCVSPGPFTARTPGGPVTPPWYADDPRRATAQIVYVAARATPEHPADFVVEGRFVTHRFVDVAARTVAHFDEAHPERNDYRDGSETLLLFGRPAFVGTGGVQNLPFLLYVKLGRTPLRFAPRFFAGYGESGAPRWSDREVDAQPIYGTEATVTPRGTLRFDDPEFDYDNQMTVAYVAPLARWVMLYGGDVPAFMVRDPVTGVTPEPAYPQPSPGAIHLRSSLHPWGRPVASSPRSEGWGPPMPVLTRRVAAPFLACGEGGEEFMPGCLENGDAPPAAGATRGIAKPSLRDSLSCAVGEVALGIQKDMSGNPIGRLYAPNVISSWTDDTSGSGRRSAEIYWNVSTWNPYQVVLVKTRLTETSR